MGEFWDKHYLNFSEQESSKFCVYVIQNYLKPTDYVIELGCGNGRDGLRIAKTVEFYEGVDLAASAISSANELFRSFQIPDSRYLIRQGDFSQTMTNQQIGERLVIYSRFSLHSDSEDAENQLLSNLALVKNKKLLVLIEVRTIYDDLFGKGKKVGKNAFVTDHYRRFIDPVELRSKISKQFEILDYQLSKGLAPYKAEDPIVLRAVFRNKV